MVRSIAKRCVSNHAAPPCFETPAFGGLLSMRPRSDLHCVVCNSTFLERLLALGAHGATAAGLPRSLRTYAALMPCRLCEASLQVKNTTSASGVAFIAWMLSAGM
jgi:hypothetical protein